MECIVQTIYKLKPRVSAATAASLSAGTASRRYMGDITAGGTPHTRLKASSDIWLL